MAKDPSEMTDEELDKELGIEPKPAPKEEPKEGPETPDEPESEEEVEETEEEEPEVEEGEEEPEPKPKAKAKEEPSRREQLRVQQLLTKYPALAPTQPPPAAPDALDYETALEADPETIAKLKADRERTNKAFYEQGIDQAKTLQFHTRLEIDAPKIEAKYPQLDKNSQDFKPALANAINTMFLTTVGYNPGDATKGVPERVTDANLRYSDYVESIFELADEIAGESTATTKKEIAKQAAKTGLRPDGTGTKKLNLNKLPSQMTDEELDAVIARGIPTR